MAKQRNASKLMQLAVLVSGGLTVTAASKEVGLRPRTAQEWSRLPEFRSIVAEHRGYAVDAAMGKLATHASNAVVTLVKLMIEGKTESTRLMAARAVLDKLIEIDAFVATSRQIAQMQQQIAELTSIVNPDPTVTLTAIPALEAPAPLEVASDGQAPLQDGQ